MEIDRLYEIYDILSAKPDTISEVSPTLPFLKAFSTAIKIHHL